MTGTSWRTWTNFNPLPPHGGRLDSSHRVRYMVYFNPLPPHGGRPALDSERLTLFYFNPLPPHGGRRISSSLTSYSGHFNPLPPHGGRPAAQLHGTTYLNISIHSLRMEGDTGQIMTSKSPNHFNPLPPHGGRPCLTSVEIPEGTFQSTPSAWRETRNCEKNRIFRNISIHSLRMEGDTADAAVGGVISISIHSLRMEGDALYNADCFLLPYFNPLPPHGGRQLRYTHGIRATAFQSTPSAWRETHYLSGHPEVLRNFNPLPPHGGRPWCTIQCKPFFRFQSTPSAWRETWDDPGTLLGTLYFNPLPPHGGRRGEVGNHVTFAVISIHSLRMEGDSFGQGR